MLLPLFLFLLPLLLSSISTAKTTSTLPSTSTPATSTTPSYTNTTLFQLSLLTTHNTYRTAHNASLLSWNTSLATSSLSHSLPCKFSHSTPPAPGAYGENLAAGYPNTTAAVEAWGDEREDYDFEDAEFSDETGHFTQVVWKGSTDVGCGATWCDGQEETPGWFVVCRYFPAGNVEGGFEENVQEEEEEDKEEGKEGGVGGLGDRMTRWWGLIGMVVVVVGVCGGW
ncbi:MAG: hypothetical protein Q9169_007011 [Polycauliona sp. 2 TL-2023]